MSQDELYSPEFKTYIKTFLDITSREYKAHQVSACITMLSKSLYISALMKDPKNEQIRSCIREYLRNNKDLNSSFLNRFLAYLDVTIQPSQNYGFGQSATVCVNTKTLAQTSKPLTRFTVIARQQQLIDEIDKCQEYPTKAHYKNLLVDTRLKLDNTLVDNLLFSEIKLNNFIMEGAQLNGYEPDSFITRKQKIKNSFAGL